MNTSPLAAPPEPLVITRDQAEILGVAPNTVELLVNAAQVSGHLGATRIHLGEGHGGATPHLHRSSAELFFVLDGALQVLLGDAIVTVRPGDALVVPPGTVHAFGAAPGAVADVLIVVAPGVERADYFRLLDRIRLGAADKDELLRTQELYDSHFVQSTTWQDARATA